MKAAGIDNLRLSISKIKDLPTVPLVLTKILDLVEDQNSTIQELERAILSDQSITAKVLRLANSAFYGFPRKITTISKAIILIGFNSVKNIAIGVSVFEAFQRGNRKGAGEIESAWAHAVEVAFGAKMLASKF
ncbi:MAG: HDOD domain-containing protein, partial [Deltaproteobacteria bacterium]|nr:HDOD domain-containing protein [Deltaproteobacteria bacterium]